MGSVHGLTVLEPELALRLMDIQVCSEETVSESSLIELTHEKVKSPAAKITKRNFFIIKYSKIITFLPGRAMNNIRRLCWQEVLYHFRLLAKQTYQVQRYFLQRLLSV